jgi:hypothetical protein
MNTFTLHCPSSQVDFFINNQDEYTKTHVCPLCMSRFAIPRKAKSGDKVKLQEHTLKIITPVDISQTLTRRINALKKQLKEEKSLAVMQRAILDLLNDFKVTRYESAN